MSATIELLPRKEFRITLESGQSITGKFGTYAMKLFQVRKNINNDKITEYFTSRLYEAFPDYILCAVENHFRELKTKDAFPYNDIDACNWIDEIGGINSDDVSRLIIHATPDEKKIPLSNEPANP